MSRKHLAAGSQKIPKVDGKLRLYSMEFCPYALRARLILQAKKVDHDVVNINLLSKPEWYFEIHPEGKVPALDTGSEVIVESLVIADFLDEKYPEPALYPAEPASKEKDKELIKKIDPITTFFYKILVDKSKTPEEWIKEAFPHVQVFEEELIKRGTKFFFGDRPGMVDYMLWPWAEKTGVFKIAFGNDFSIGKEKFPKLCAWKESMMNDSAVKATYHDPQNFWKIFQAKLNNDPSVYDKLQNI